MDRDRKPEYPGFVETPPVRKSRTSTPAVENKRASYISGNGEMKSMEDEFPNVKVNGSGTSNGLKEGGGEKNTIKVEKKKETSAPEEPKVHSDPKIDASGEFEFGGAIGTGFAMVFFPFLMWYLWIGQEYYNGQLPLPTKGESWSDFASNLLGYVLEVRAVLVVRLLAN